MKKEVIIFALLSAILFLALPAASATIVEKKIISPVVYKELTIPAKVRLYITNDAAADDYFIIDTLLDISFVPHRTPVLVKKNETKEINLDIYPSNDLKEKNTGNFAFSYYIKGDISGLTEDKIVIQIVSARNLFDVQIPDKVGVLDKSFSIELENRYEKDLSANVIVTSELFEGTSSIMLPSDEAMNVTLPLERKKLELYEAGTYPLKVKVLINNEFPFEIEKQVQLESFVNISTSTSEEKGIFGKSTSITKVNEGNIPAIVTIRLNKTAFEDWFTTFNIKPITKKADNILVYEWRKELISGESFKVVSTTNYSTPLIFLLVIVLIVFLISGLTKSKVVITKRAVKVLTKSGQFASKIILQVKNRGPEIRDVWIIDALPAFTELYEKFGTVKPEKIEKGMLKWHLSQLTQGEELILSYILYSKVKVLGKLEVPPATIMWIDKKDTHQREDSNTLFILSEEIY